MICFEVIKSAYDINFFICFYIIDFYWMYYNKYRYSTEMFANFGVM